MKSTFRIEAEANRDEAFPSGDRDKSSTTAFGSLNDETLKGKMSLCSWAVHIQAAAQLSCEHAAP